MSIEKTVFIYADSARGNFYNYKAVTGNISLDEDSGTSEEIVFNIVVDSSAKLSRTRKEIRWAFPNFQPPGSTNDDVWGYGFHAAKAPGNRSATRIGEVFTNFRLTENDQSLSIEDANQPDGGGGNNSYGFTVTVFGWYDGATRPIELTTDPTIRNRNDN